MKINGIGASSGIVFGKVFKLQEVELEIPTYKCADIEKELTKLNKAITQAEETISEIKCNAMNSLDEEHAMI